MVLCGVWPRGTRGRVCNARAIIDHKFVFVERAVLRTQLLLSAHLQPSPPLSPIQKKNGPHTQACSSHLITRPAREIPPPRGLLKPCHLVTPQDAALTQRCTHRQVDLLYRTW